jgi:hypothetical protein
MPWPIAQTGGDSHALAKRFELLERRLRLVEQQAVQPATVSGDFIAHEGETIFVSAPTAGAVGLLPTAKSANRGATITLVCQTTNPVTLRTVSGNINGQLSITRQRVGTYQLVSDGASGWWAPSLGLPRPRDAAIQDWFCSGNVTSGQIGSLGWNLTGVGTPACTRNATGMAASTKLTLTTTAAANDRTTLCLAQNRGGQRGQAVGVRRHPDRAELQRSYGDQAPVFWPSDDPGHGARLRCQFARVPLRFVGRANWLTIARFGTTGTATDTGVAASSADALLTIWQQSPMTFRFYIGQVLVGTIAGTLAVSACHERRVSPRDPDDVGHDAPCRILRHDVPRPR